MNTLQVIHIHNLLLQLSPSFFSLLSCLPFSSPTILPFPPRSPSFFTHCPYFPLLSLFNQAAADKAKAQVEEQKKKAREAADRADKEANRIADQAKQAKADLKASAKKAESAVDEGIEKARGMFSGLKGWLK